MSISPTSSDPGRVRLADPVVARPGEAELRVHRALVGRTPLLRLQRSGDGLVWIKREGRNLSGSLLDRLVLPQLEASTGPVAVSGWGLLALATLCHAATAGRQVHHVVARGTGPRLRALCQAYGNQVEVVSDATEVAARLRALSQQGVTVMRADGSPEVRSAWSGVAQEVTEALGEPPAAWVVSACGATEADVEAGIHASTGTDAAVEFVAWDDGSERVLDGSAACRRQQVAHREGLLLSPLGAELVERAVQTALARQESVCVVLPEDGHRYLGWW